MEPKVIFEDSEMLVLDKPSGIIVNRSQTTAGQITVQDWLEKKFPVFNVPKGMDLSIRVSPDENGEISREMREAEFYKRAGIVHRIDRETSGILLVAKNPGSFANLQNQFKNRQVKKTYLALVHGRIDPSSGDIRVPVGRLPWNRTKFGVVMEGKEAATGYKVLNFYYLVSGKSKEPLSLLELHPQTGRTHQIRVHLKYFNHPIFGDFLYAGRKTARADRLLLPRVFLHAGKLSLMHPKTGGEIFFESPLPWDLTAFIKVLARE